jgi:hypothetical protein
VAKEDIYALRVTNLRKLIAQYGGPTALARTLGHKNGSQLAQTAGPNPTRPIGERFARDVEEALSLPRHWLDRQHGTASTDAALDDALLADVIGAINSTPGVGKLAAAKVAKITTMAYERASALGHVDVEHIRRLVELGA